MIVTVAPAIECRDRVTAELIGLYSGGLPPARRWLISGVEIEVIKFGNIDLMYDVLRVNGTEFPTLVQFAPMCFRFTDIPGLGPLPPRTPS